MKMKIKIKIKRVTSVMLALVMMISALSVSALRAGAVEAPAESLATLSEKLDWAKYITERKYPDEASYYALLDAIAAGNSAMADQTEANIAAAVALLSDAIDHMQYTQVYNMINSHDFDREGTEGFTALRNALAGAKYGYYDLEGGRGYDHDSTLNIYFATVRAVEAYDNAVSLSNDELIAAAEELRAAFDNAKEPDIDENSLWEMIELADKYFMTKDDYTEESLMALGSAYTGAKPTFYYSIFQDELDAAEQELKDAIDGLRIKGGYIIGDVDNSGDVDITDATRIQRHVLTITPLNAALVKVGDFNRDGECDIIDATAIQRYLIDLPYPIG